MDEHVMTRVVHSHKDVWQATYQNDRLGSREPNPLSEQELLWRMTLDVATRRCRN